MAISDTLESRPEREAFLDAWYSFSRKTFNAYHKRFNGNGRKMISELESQNTRLFIAVFEVAHDNRVTPPANLGFFSRTDAEGRPIGKQ